MSLGLPEPALLILVSLASGPKHGYAIILDVEALCGLRMGPGTLYGAIARLERLGLIAPLPAEDRRRPYRLTEAGATELRDELATLRDVATAGLRRLAAT
ncbi:MAG TPA: PadR family transcriptional regulator [Chloroflexota bacterium]|jgi:DNA-binding PadR family transcriptional regulator